MENKTKLTKQEKLEIIIKDNTEMIDLLIAGMGKLIRTNHNLIEVLKTITPNHLLTENPKLTTLDILDSAYAIPKTNDINAIKIICEALVR